MPGLPLSPAERQRRCKTRRRTGARYARGDVPADLIAWMIEHGWTSEAEAADPDALWAALIDLADCAARGRLRKTRLAG
jgi:hypothetical protein